MHVADPKTEQEIGAFQERFNANDAAALIVQYGLGGLHAFQTSSHGHLRAHSTVTKG